MTTHLSGCLHYKWPNPTLQQAGHHAAFECSPFYDDTVHTDECTRNSLNILVKKPMQQKPRECSTQTDGDPGMICNPKGTVQESRLQHPGAMRGFHVKNDVGRRPSEYQRRRRCRLYAPEELLMLLVRVGTRTFTSPTRLSAKQRWSISPC